MGQALTVALEPELYLVVELAHMFVIGERGQVLVSRGLACFPVRARQDSQVNVVGVTSVRVRLRKDMQSVRVQIGHVRAVYAVEVTLERPARQEIRVLQHLLDLLWKYEGGAIAVLINLEAADLFIDESANLATGIWRDIDGVGVRTHRRVRLVKAEDVAHPEANFTVAPDAYGRPRTRAVIAEQ